MRIWLVDHRHGSVEGGQRIRHKGARGGIPYGLRRKPREGPLGLSRTWDAATEELEDEDEEEDEWSFATCDMAPDIAAALGTSPLKLGPQPRVRGIGVLAHTP
ncbi:hypothetical protein [Streptomyces violascens]|uniref:hypothetical protein n=1 Tax=Streptomyces violascens TaxID=67381 RepID=UPI0036AAD754